MPKDIWRNDIERAAWVERNCRVCYQPDEARARLTDQHGCPHLMRSLQNKLPTPWKRRRNAPLGETYKCEAFIKQPPVVRRGKAVDQTVPMLDAEPEDYNLVPVEGWPDWRAEARKQKEGDHQ